MSTRAAASRLLHHGSTIAWLVGLTFTFFSAMPAFAQDSSAYDRELLKKLEDGDFANIGTHDGALYDVLVVMSVFGDTKCHLPENMVRESDQANLVESWAIAMKHFNDLFLRLGLTKSGHPLYRRTAELFLAGDCASPSAHVVFRNVMDLFMTRTMDRRWDRMRGSAEKGATARAPSSASAQTARERPARNDPNAVNSPAAVGEPTASAPGSRRRADSGAAANPMGKRWLARCETEAAQSGSGRREYFNWCQCTADALVAALPRLTEAERKGLELNYSHQIVALEINRLDLRDVLGNCRRR